MVLNILLGFFIGLYIANKRKDKAYTDRVTQLENKERELQENYKKACDNIKQYYEQKLNGQETQAQPSARNRIGFHASWHD